MIKAILGKKIGMTQVYTEEGRAYPATVIDVSGVKISKHLKDADQTTHIELGLGQKKKPNQADLGNYKELGYVPQFRQVIRIEGTPNLEGELSPIGTELGANIFELGDKVDVAGITKGKGFQGVMKRWGFKGGPKTHGGPTGKMRSGGSIGAGTTPGRVFKGKKMPGHMGNRSQTVQNLRIVQIEGEQNLIAVKGALPGSNGSYVKIISTTHRLNG